MSKNDLYHNVNIKDMNSKKILLALQSGKISFQEAKEKIVKEKSSSLYLADVKENLHTMDVVKNGENLLNNDLNLEFKPKSLGSPIFKERYNCKWNYVSGSMFRGITSEELVVTMADANLLSFFGSAGLSVKEIEVHIKNIQSKLSKNEPYGMCLIYNLNNQEKEMKCAELFIKYNVPVIEAAAYPSLTLPLVYIRVKGLHKDGDKIVFPRRIMGKCSRLEIAEMFLSPPPIDMIKKLLKDGMISEEEAMLSQCIPVVDDISIEADSGGHTDQGVSFTLIPTIMSLKGKLRAKFNYKEEILVGCGGGIGTPEAVASAFTLGADYIFVGSINQCTVESGAHSVIKDILSKISIHDTGITVAGDLFELGAKAQVVKKNSQFYTRSNRLYRLFTQYNSIEDIPESVRREIENKYFKKTFSEVWQLVCEYKNKKNPEQIKEAEDNPRLKTALIFKWYYAHCNSITLSGNEAEKDNFAIFSGPSLGAFNQWVKGTIYGNWENRHAYKIAELLMNKACEYIINKDHSFEYENSDIAIVGMSGQFPKARNLTEFWENICNGRDCISEIPETRWSIDRYYDENTGIPGKTNSKWMGILEDVDKFDPLFFNISPIEAETMDPQQRLFLENCWSCIEDAGVKPTSLSGSRCGVFVGCGTNDYRKLDSNEELNAQSLTGNSSSILSARISYFLNLKGPCLSIDTACSSSLVALIEACNSLILRNSDIALSGGVYAMFGPSSHISGSKAGMLSPNGRCYTFDSRANGFVSGEGVGVVLLKRLSDAVRDEDNIYGVIKGWGINQDGKTNGITAPSANSQMRLEQEVYNKFNINPETISLVEAHGTGTKLGDPIEVEALTKSFQQFTNKRNYCALGSVKSNIGHLVKAAGIAGIIKVLLSMKYKMLPPTINFQQLNEHISLEDSPFYINTVLKPWNTVNGDLRRAAISSFGFSGTNAHVVIEEYLSPKTSIDKYESLGNEMLFLLSAKSSLQLEQYALRIKEYAESTKELDMEAMTYTLQVGRDDMEHRLAYVVDSKENLINILNAFINKDPLLDVMVGEVKKRKSEVSSDVQELLETSIENRQLKKLGELWVSGLDIDWTQLYINKKPKRLHLPTYSFARERYWISDGKSKYCDVINTKIENEVPNIHPLLHKNISTFYEQRFSSIFVGDEFFLRDHVVNGKKIMPGMAYIEMARKAIEFSVKGYMDRKTYVQLRDIVWIRPLVVEDEPVSVDIRLVSGENEEIKYEIYSEFTSDNNEKIVYCQGSAILKSIEKDSFVDIGNLKSKCRKTLLNSGKCYEIFKTIGLYYGEAHKGIEKLYIGEDTVLAKLSIPSGILSMESQYILHPTILDSAFQASIGLLVDSENRISSQIKASDNPLVPFSLESVEVFGKCTTNMWALVKHSEGTKENNKLQKLDVDIMDEQGKVCITMKGHVSRLSQWEKQEPKKIQDTYDENYKEHLVGNIMMIPRWESITVNRQPIYPSTDENIIVVGDNENYINNLRDLYPSIQVVDFNDNDSIEEISNKLSLYRDIEHIIWISQWNSSESCEGEDLIAGQESGVIRCFKTIKALLNLGYGSKILGWSMITFQTQQLHKNDAVYCTHSSIHGLMGSLAKEYSNWRIRVVDLEPTNELPLKDIFTLTTDANGNCYINRGNQWYHKCMIPLQHDSAQNTAYKYGGTYVVIGGAGGIGEQWSEYVIRNYGANVIWIGRRKKDEVIEAKIYRLSKLGNAPYYISADATNYEELQSAFGEIKLKYSCVNGVIHSAIVLLDQSLAKMNEDGFREVLSTKVDVSVRIAQIFNNEPLDFIMFFSSMSSFIKSAGQSNYASGCSFKDAFAHKLSKEWSCAVKVINWGYWGSTGIVSSEEYKSRMEQVGIGSIEAPEAMEALEKLLSGNIDQTIFLKSDRPLKMKNIKEDELIKVYPYKIDSYIENVSNSHQNNVEITNNHTNKENLKLVSKIQEALMHILADLLDVNMEDLDAYVELTEYIFDLIKMHELVKVINERYNVEINHEEILEYKNINSVAQFIVNRYQEILDPIVPELNNNNNLTNIKSMTNVFRTEINTLLKKLLWCQLNGMGIFSKEGFTIEELKINGIVKPLYYSWFEESIEFLKIDNYLAVDKDNRVIVNNSNFDIDSIFAEWEIKKKRWLKDPNVKAQVALVDATVQALPKILSGKTLATEILFPESSMRMVEGIYKDNIVSDYFNEVLADTLINYIKERIKRDPSATVKIIEIGAGTGGTSAVVFRKLKEYKANIEEYCYTDISRAFLIHAEKKYGKENPYLTYKTFNVESTIDKQDIPEGAYDIVIAANVLHATKNIRQTLRNVKSILKRNGVALLNEICSNTIFVHLTFGLLEGWWLCEDRDLRIPGCPGLSPKAWKHVLQSEGFNLPSFPAEEGHELGKQIIFTESDGIVRVKTPRSREVKNIIAEDLIKNRDHEKKVVITDILLKEKSIAYLKKIISDTFKIPYEKIYSNEPLEKYGIDSILIVKLTNVLSKVLQNVNSTLFFEYENIDSLVDYFIKTQKETLIKLVGLEVKNQYPVASYLDDENKNKSLIISEVVINDDKDVIDNKALRKYNSDDIAIIGVSGRFSGADDIYELWGNLKQGKNCISEIPIERWDWRNNLHEAKGQRGKIYSKWGGFISNIDRFDPLFFQISPREAEHMDPQERLFIEEVYKSIEDSGYTPANLCNSRKVGVYVGVMNGEYDSGPRYWSIANRVSYIFNFQGPSLAIDSACSSSLSAIHLALENLYSGISELAVVGGVNLIIDSNHYMRLSAANMLSISNECRAFGCNADGFVDGEGVGAILLKPLTKAVADGDQVYGVIKGSMINSGGKTNGYTVPNPNVQAQLISDALERAKVDARAITYIEAHGTGTELGDPIEITGLTRAFEKYTQDKGFCSIGSIKSNIGHCESAAGIAGVIKVLLQLKYKQLVPSLHAKVLNPNIDFKNTPFVVQQEVQEWKKPKVSIKGEAIEYPLTAGISAFGAGGANSHVIIQEYVCNSEIANSNNPVIIILSAKNIEQLRCKAERLLNFISLEELHNADLENIAYTLQVGREEMTERLAFIAGNVEELCVKLKAFIKGDNEFDGLYFCQAKNKLASFLTDVDLTETIDKWISMSRYDKLAEFWVNGLSLNWNRLYIHSKPKRISLPTYPFGGEKYWIHKIQHNTSKIEGNYSLKPETIYTEKDIVRRICFLEKRWKYCPIDKGIAVEKTVAILTTAETLELGTKLAKQFSRSEIIDLYDIKLQLNQSEQYWKNYGGVIDLIGCGKYKDDSLDWIVWLQRLIENCNKKGLILLCVTKGLESYKNSDINLSGACRAGLYRMLQSEYSYVKSRHMDSQGYIDEEKLVGEIAGEFLADNEEPEICYRDSKRYKAIFEEFIDQPNGILEFPKNHVLLITGGTRGIGYLCAEHFIKKYGVKLLVITGREKMPARELWNSFRDVGTSISKKIKAIEALEAYGVQVEVLSDMISDQKSMDENLKNIKENMGPIGGVIHCAGLADFDNPAFIRKSVDGIKNIFEPKVSGLNVVYNSLKAEPLKFFILFSSVSSIVPTLATGQSDYAMANAYMDYFSEAQKSSCPMISIQWTNWKDTGMGEVKSKVYEQTGLLGMSNEEGIKILDDILASKTSSVLLPAVVNDDLWSPNKLIQHDVREKTIAVAKHNQIIAEESLSGRDDLKDKVQCWLRKLFADELKLDSSRLELDVSFNEYGLDSILLAQVIIKMEKSMVNVSLEPSVILEYPNIVDLSDYLIYNYADELKAIFLINGDIEAFYESDDVKKRLKSNEGNRSTFQKEKIAVIGMGCHFPDASNISEYWNNLKLGKDSMREIPKSRWDTKKFYSSNGYIEGKSISNLGAFLEDIEKLDAEYFKIPESLAPQIDPLQRQILEVSTEALVDSGYSKKDLWGKKVGVFVGARAGTFASKINGNSKDRIVGVGQNFIAAHLAHIYNFKGPNMVIDTACSSSLTAIHMAIRSIQMGESELVLAGGVDILLDEKVFIELSSANVLSPDGRCKSFDADANGIGLGEGCGVLVLKPLSKAIKDNDKIYGVIDGSAINNDGNTMGVTTPNPEAQKEIIESAIIDAGVNPETITYIETHGTGTLIGDPIELKALTGVFSKYTSRKQFCGVGSVKSNIGHTLCSAGAASIIKVLLSIINGQLPPTLHCNNPNPRFKFNDSQLYIVKQLMEWNGENNILRAGISSFGLGGNNAHIIISNEGIPATHKANVIPKGNIVNFNRKYYWPQELTNISKRDDNIILQEADDEEFMKIFEIVEG
ncbi:PfaD family polyunsaturated fatty acid/polyketide biosynthesis protein [Clostridium estertheticum]|uniref:PfaD family polyunsaturated fatty acid/polyketide biosynthesis protein n=1 Tax=Clostridium estertheticum TaxID=238834 RepID=UPI001CF271E8|nr:PfaD family polyunsaturated fatty acid/polyketide biosynthesis protein [Clostridium estertheticum]MCB2360146.1 PfaD family polyunsaturated fatty acid/polyketide biosynthesis protein [Clostridium estertheticum]